MSRREIPFAIDLRVPVMSVTRRTGALLEGSEGWGEWSPLPSWSAAEREGARRFAEECADLPFPAALREEVEVNLMVPRVDAATATALVVEAGCRTVKVKVGDEGDLDRVAAVRDALGPEGIVRLDANGAWSLEQATERLPAFLRYDIELVEDPVQEMDDLSRLRRLVGVPIAAESCVRTVADAKRLGRAQAADAFVVKPQRIGGVGVALEAAGHARMPVIVSSALETSVGLAGVLAVAAALGDQPFACGIGTALLLAEDVTREPLKPSGGRLRPRRVEPDLLT